MRTVLLSILLSLLPDHGGGTTLQQAPQPYIVGGRSVDRPGKWPWQGSLQYLGRHKCGAVLIAPYYVLTAAHCVNKVPVNLMWVTFGLHDKDTQYEGDPQSYKIARITIHDEYKPEEGAKYANDLAIIQLTSDRPADVTSQYINTIPMATTNATFLRSPCVITGWGNTRGSILADGQSPNILQEAPTAELPLADCEDRCNWNLTDRNICTLYNNATGACTGDGGGPLVCWPHNAPGNDTDDVIYVTDGTSEFKDGSSRAQLWQLAGIDSWEGNVCDTTKPNVYIRISQYRPWIKKVTGL